MPSDSHPEKFFVTTPIYYVNARPHIGHAYTTIVADVLARRARAQGTDTFFLTGTDEHGQKIERSAAAAGIPPQQFADEVSQSFQTLWHRMGITNDAYIRTTDAAHKRGVQKLFADLHARGHIYLSSYTGQYSIGEEMFVEGPPGTIGPDGKPTETVTEENFFFRLSDYQLPLLNLIESDTLKITPESRKNEVLSFLRGNVATVMHEMTDKWQGPIDVDQIERAAIAEGKLAETAFDVYVPGALKDLSVSRSSFTWGIPVPEPAASEAKEKHVIYVWLDALANYMTALGYGDDSPEAQARFQKYWPADLHLVGKEIIRFHCVYWPAFLLALNPALTRTPDEPTPNLTFEQHKAWAEQWLPKAVTAHGWLLFEDSKMSKSKGNIVRAETILEAFGTLCPSPITAQTTPVPHLRDGNIVAKVGLEQGSTALPTPAPTPTGAPSQAVSPLEVGSIPPQEAVILSEARSAQSKDPEEAHPAPTAETLSATTATHNTTPPSLSPLSFRSAAKESASPVQAPTPTPTPLPPTTVIPGEARNLGIPPTPPEPTKEDRDLFAADILRYYLLREIPFGQDGSFSFDSLITRYNADLANGYGNLVSRTLKLVDTGLAGTFVTVHHFGFAVGSGSNIEETMARGRHSWTLGVTTYPDDLWDASPSLEQAFQSHIQGRNFSQAIELISSAIKQVDSFMSESEPWKVAKGDAPNRASRLNAVLYTAAESIRIITALLYPILPHATANVWRQLGLGDIEQAAAAGELRNLKWGGLKPGTKLGPLSPIFPRADKGLAQLMSDLEQKAAKPTPSNFVDENFAASPATPLDPTHPGAPPRTGTLTESNPGLQVAGSDAITTERHGTPPHHEAPASGIFAGQQPADASPQITIDDFAKVELRVAKILVAERIPKADKLLRLEVDLGYEKRQILSGIAEWYTPEDLIGRRIVVITNLAPRKMRGLESHGMLLAASAPEGGKPSLTTFPDSDDLPLGSRLK